MREFRLFLLTVGVPAVLLMAAGARLVYAEWRFESRAKERFDSPAREMRPLRRPPPPKPEGDWGRRPPPPKPPPMLRLFSPRYGMNGPRELTIFGCLVGLTLLSLVSGSWLLMRAARKARQEALEQTDFVSNISHEFKTPLTTICLCAELAQDDGLDAARRKKALTAIRDESERLKRLVLDALDFSRLEKRRYHYDLATVDVAELARETCAAFSPRLNEATLHAPEGNCLARADANAVRHILTNLLDNAAKYAPQSDVEVLVRAEGDARLLTVADRGPGLTSDELKHVFDRFWRGDNSVTRETGGSGLGLAIAHALAEGMGGRLTAANRPDGGAVFTLELKS